MDKHVYNCIIGMDTSFIYRSLDKKNIYLVHKFYAPWLAAYIDNVLKYKIIDTGKGYEYSIIILFDNEQKIIGLYQYGTVPQ